MQDSDTDKIAKFDEVYEKLMKEPDADELDERYVGRRKLANCPSLNSLARIQAKYNEDDDTNAQKQLDAALGIDSDQQNNNQLGSQGSIASFDINRIVPAN